jgi:hypothetical protein
MMSERQQSMPHNKRKKSVFLKSHLFVDGVLCLAVNVYASARSRLPSFCDSSSRLKMLLIHIRVAVKAGGCHYLVCQDWQ